MKRYIIATVVLLASYAAGHAWHAQEKLLAGFGQSATPTNIAKVISGRSCRGPDGDTILFGTADASATFEHAGHTSATYRLGYASVLVDRAGEVHSHLVTVDPTRNVLHIYGKEHQC